MRWFEPFRPPGDLDDVLACTYVATTAGRHDLIPDGCMDMLFVDRLGVVLCGPDTTAWSFELPAGTEVCGIRFRPGAAAGLFRVDAVDLKDRRVALADLLGGRTERLVAERLAAADDAAQRVAVLEGFVRRRPPDDPGAETVQLAALIGADRSFGVERLAAETGVSSRQLRRRFDRHVGYGPAFLARVSRLQRFVHSAAHGAGRGLAELAASAGYADQAHLARDARAISGRTPRQLVEVLPRTSVAVTLGDVRSVQDRAGRRRPRSAA